MRNPKKRRHAFLVLLLLLGITGIVFIGTDGFQIKEVTIVGNGKISKEDIIKRAGIPHNQNIFKLNKQLIKERLETEPYLEVLSIKRQYPNGVIITVREKEAAGVIPYLNSYYVIDRDCYIMEIADSLDNCQYPLIRGVQISNFLVGKRLIASDEYQLKVLSRILESLKDLGLEDQISEIIVDNPEDVELILISGMRAKIGQAIEVDKKLIWLKSQEMQDILNGISGGILDLSVPSKPVFYSDES
ncbi:MAG: cell division protein FtsQ/DivIB [Caldicoprobacterales bacterium]|jgi:cell division protein FtsQ|nr:FtsQ-type POTRA domain-containing protein [Clostridiales bacterium]